jgi:hypothetical protein
MATFIIGAIDQDAANTSGAHFTQRDFLLACHSDLLHSRCMKSWGKAFMSEFSVWALSLPSIVLYAICGAIGGAIGGLFSFAAEKLFGANKAWRIIPIIFVVASIQLTTKVVLPSLQHDAAPYAAIEEMKKSRLFGAIFRYHPDAEAQTIEKLKQVLSGPNDRRQASARAIGAALADKYVNLHILMASDDAIHNLMQSEVAILSTVRAQPDACVALYLGSASAPIDKVPPELLNAKLNARAEVIETSVAQPSPPLTNVTVDTLGQILMRAYQTNGFDIQEISKLSDVGSLPPKDGCLVAYHFLSAMASLDPKDGTTVYKGLIRLSK